MVEDKKAVLRTFTDDYLRWALDTKGHGRLMIGMNSGQAAILRAPEIPGYWCSIEPLDEDDIAAELARRSAPKVEAKREPRAGEVWELVRSDGATRYAVISRPQCPGPLRATWLDSGFVDCIEADKIRGRHWDFFADSLDSFVAKRAAELGIGHGDDCGHKKAWSSVCDTLSELGWQYEGNCTPMDSALAFIRELAASRGSGDKSRFRRVWHACVDAGMEHSREDGGADAVLEFIAGLVSTREDYDAIYNYCYSREEPDPAMCKSYNFMHYIARSKDAREEADALRVKLAAAKAALA